MLRGARKYKTAREYRVAPRCGVLTSQHLLMPRHRGGFMTEDRQRRIDAKLRRRLERRVRAFLGHMLCFDVAVLSSFLGWLPQFTGIPYREFLAATAVLGLVFGFCAAYGDRQR